MLLNKALEGFMMKLAGDGYSKNTSTMYNHYLHLLSNHLGNPELGDVNPDNLMKFWAWVQHDYLPKRANGDQSPLKPATIENIWIAIRSFYNWAESDLGIVRPDRKLKRPKFQPTIIEPFSQEEVKRLISNESLNKSRSRDRDKAIILILLDTGVRVGELSRLLIGDCNIASGELLIRPFGTGRKTHPRPVYIGKAARSTLWRYLANNRDGASTKAFLFINNQKRQMSTSSIRWMLKRRSKSVGVRNVYPHRFRHSFAIGFLRNGGDVYSLQSILGHSTLQMVLRYLAIADRDLARAHQSASPVDGWNL